jgi:phospholipid transport system substrate-binding protein
MIRQAALQRARVIDVLKLFITAAMLGACAVVQAQEEPDKLVRQVAEDVLKTLRDDPELRQANPQKMAQLIETKVAPHFDFERMTRLAVGRNWRQATPEQRQALIEQFRTLLIRSYSSAYSAFRNIVVEVKPTRLQAGDDDVQVRSEIKLPGGAPPVTVDYSMYKGDAAWKVYDVTVDGVSLVTTYRGTFADEIRQGGIDGLVKSLREKNTLPIPTKKSQ